MGASASSSAHKSKAESFSKGKGKAKVKTKGAAVLSNPIFTLSPPPLHPPPNIHIPTYTPAYLSSKFPEIRWCSGGSAKRSGSGGSSKGSRAGATTSSFFATKEARPTTHTDAAGAGAGTGAGAAVAKEGWPRALGDLVAIGFSTRSGSGYLKPGDAVAVIRDRSRITAATKAVRNEPLL